MNKLASILILSMCWMASFACSSNSDSPDNAQPPINDGERIEFLDDFDTFDETVWNKETHNPGWTNGELQYYDPAHVSVGKDGEKTVLMLTAEHKEGKIISGRINSKGNKSFKYGKIEASIKLPKTANGLWPAFWMMGETNEWPACGELDIMEMGDAAGIRTGTTTQRVNTAIHFGPNEKGHRQEYYAANAKGNLQDGNYHIYAVLWDEKEIQILIDGSLFHSFNIKNNQYFHDNFFILFNLAVGGEFTGIDDKADITALKEGQKAVMYVDWVRVTDNK